MSNVRRWFETEEVILSRPVYGYNKHATLESPLHAVWGDLSIVVMPGYVTDGASIPRAAWRVIGHPFGPYLAAAVVHDALYGSQVVSREVADQCFRDLMEELGIARWKRALMYRAVRMAGGFVWARRSEADVDAAADYVEVRHHVESE